MSGTTGSREQGGVIPGEVEVPVVEEAVDRKDVAVVHLYLDFLNVFHWHQSDFGEGNGDSAGTRVSGLFWATGATWREGDGQYQHRTEAGDSQSFRQVVFASGGFAARHRRSQRC